MVSNSRSLGIEFARIHFEPRKNENVQRITFFPPFLPPLLPFALSTRNGSLNAIYGGSRSSLVAFR